MTKATPQDQNVTVAARAMAEKSPGGKIVKNMKRAKRKHQTSEEEIRIALDGLLKESSELARGEATATS